MLDKLKGKLIVWTAQKVFTEDGLVRKLAVKFITAKLKKLTEGKMKGSWKTTASGVGAILTSLGLLAKGLSESDMGLVGAGVTGIISGIGLLLARDNDKSSEDVGTK